MHAALRSFVHDPCPVNGHGVVSMIGPNDGDIDVDITHGENSETKIAALSQHTLGP